MPWLTLTTGLLLILLGVATYVAYPTPTALIPAAFGLLLGFLGLLARHPRARMHAIHAAAALALVGFVGSVASWATLPSLLAGEEVARPGAVVARSVMALLCLVFVGLTIRSFVAARLRRRNAPESGESSGRM